MNIRIPRSGQAAKLAKAFLREQGIEASHQQCLELVARLHGYQDWHAMEADKRFEHKPALKPVSSDEYELTEGSLSAWVQVENISVYVRRNDEGVSVDLFPVGQEDGGSLVGTWLTFDEAKLDEDEEATGRGLKRIWIQREAKRDRWYWSESKLEPLLEGAATRREGVFGPFDFEQLLEHLQDNVGAPQQDFEVSWTRPSHETPKSEDGYVVLQDEGFVEKNKTLRESLEMARNMRDAGADGVWTVETDDDVVVAVFI